MAVSLELKNCFVEYTKQAKKYKQKSNSASARYRTKLNQAKNRLTSSGRKLLMEKVGRKNLVKEANLITQHYNDVLGNVPFYMPGMQFSESEFDAIVRDIERKQYQNYSLSNGAKPYAYCFGSNNSCGGYGCSQISVRTPSNSDVLVTIKKNGQVYRHAYIKAGHSYTFKMPGGTYQPFFYYGKGWNPNKPMKQTSCGMLKGGFSSNEHFGKDSPQSLYNQSLRYELILQQNGNFSTRPSNKNEAF